MKDFIKFKSDVAFFVREFFRKHNYLEVDTPMFSKYIIPESSIEVFSTEESNLQKEKYFLVPSPEVHIKKLLAKYACSIFSLSHCFRAGESQGRLHNPEFTMLEYYTVEADYLDSLKITEKLFSFLVKSLRENSLLDKKTADAFNEKSLCISMDDAFAKYANFYLSENQKYEDLLAKVKDLSLSVGNLENYSYQDLYELVLVSCLEPNLPKNRLVVLMDYPAVSPTLSKHKIANGMEVTERWELYFNGVELANCYSELRDASKVDEFFADEIKKRKEKGFSEIVPPPNFAKTCATMPRCSGVAMGFDRLLMLLAGRKSIESF